MPKFTVLPRMITPQRPVTGAMQPGILFDGVNGLADNLSYQPDVGSNGITYPFPCLINMETKYTLEKFRWFDGTGSDYFEIWAGSTITNLSLVRQVDQVLYNQWDEQPCTLTNIQFIQIILTTPQGRAPSEFEIYYTAQTGPNYIVPTSVPRTLPYIKDTVGVNNHPGGPSTTKHVKLKKLGSAVRQFMDMPYFFKEVAGALSARFSNSYGGGINDTVTGYYADIWQHFCLQYSPNTIKNIASSGHTDNKKPIPFGANPELPASYKPIAEAYYMLGCYYFNGGKSTSDVPLDFVTEFSVTQPNHANLNHVKSVENWNEPDKTWEGLDGYFKAIEYFAYLTTAYDGDEGRLGAKVGFKAADPTIKVAMAGLVTVNTSYLKELYLLAQELRTDKKIPCDIVNVHQYYSNDVNSTSPEEWGLYSKLAELVEWVSTYAPHMLIWWTETGWDTNSSIEAAVAIGPFTKEDVQGMRSVRALQIADRAGIDKTFLFTFADEYNQTEASTDKYYKSGYVTSEFSGYVEKRSYWYVAGRTKIFEGTTFKYFQFVDYTTYHANIYKDNAGNLLVWYSCPTSNNNSYSVSINLPVGTWSAAKKYVLNGGGLATESIVSNTAASTHTVNESPIAFLYTADTSTPSTPMATQLEIATKITQSPKNTSWEGLAAHKEILNDLNTSKEHSQGVPTSNGQVYTKNTDGTGVWATVLSSSALNAYLPKAGGTMTGALVLASDPLNPLEAATMNYVDTQLSSAIMNILKDQGNYSASGNTFPVAANTFPVVSSIKKGFLWTISVAGTLGGVPVTPGDVVRALVASPGQTAANWAIGENNIGYVPVNEDGYYLNPSWIGTLAYGKITGAPGAGVGLVLNNSTNAFDLNLAVTDLRYIPFAGSNEITGNLMNNFSAGTFTVGKVMASGYSNNVYFGGNDNGIATSGPGTGGANVGRFGTAANSGGAQASMTVYRNGVQAQQIRMYSDSSSVGTIEFYGADLELKDAAQSIIFRSPNNARWKVNVSDLGVLMVTAM